MDANTSNPFLLNMLKRLNRRELLYSDINIDEIDINAMSIHNQKAVQQNIQLTHQIINVLSKADKTVHLTLPVKTKHPRYKTAFYYGITEKESNLFFNLDEISHQLKLVKKPFINYLRDSQIKNQVSDKLLFQYMSQSKALVEYDLGQMSHSLREKISNNHNNLGFKSFSDILRNRNAILRYRQYQLKEIQSVINDHFSFFKLCLKVIFHPFKYWNRKSMTIIRFRRQAREEVIEEMNYNKMLSQAGLDKNIDNFFRRWCYCLTPKDLFTMTNAEIDSILILLKQKEVLSRIKTSSFVPQQVKSLMSSSPWEAFSLLVSMNDTRFKTIHEKKGEHVEANEKKAKSNVDVNQRLPYALSLFDNLQALINPAKAQQLYGVNHAIVEGVLTFARPRPLSRRVKRMNKLTEYQRILLDIQENLVSMQYNFSFLENAEYQDQFEQLVDDISLFCQRNEEALHGSKEGEEAHCLLKKLAHSLKLIKPIDKSLRKSDENPLMHV